MATLTITTNTPKVSNEQVEPLLKKLSSKISKAINFKEEQLLIELRWDAGIIFKGSCEPAAHCFWSFGGYFKKVQNLDLRDSICEILEDELKISPYRVRITRVQLYEVLEKGGTGSNPNSFIEDSESEQMQESAIKKAVNTIKKAWSPRDKKNNENEQKNNNKQKNLLKNEEEIKSNTNEHQQLDSSSDDVNQK